jgi:hypothetical protein
MDIEYDSDGDEIRERKADAQVAGVKRRKKPSATDTIPSKRRKIQPAPKNNGFDELPPVMLVKGWATQKISDATHVAASPPVNARKLKPWSLLKNWREKLNDVPLFPSRTKTAELEEVVDADEDEDVQALDMTGPSQLPEKSEEDIDTALGGLDPEALKMALRQNLAAAGIDVNGLDEETLVSFAMRMFAGEEEGDDVAGELVDQLIGQEEDQADEEGEEIQGDGFSKWVVQQAETQASKRGAKSVQTPPGDTQASSSQLDTTPKARRPPTPKSSSSTENKSPDEKPTATSETRGSKRKAEAPIEATKSKRPARGFDAPTTASKARTMASGSSKPTRKGRKG